MKKSKLNSVLPNPWVTIGDESLGVCYIQYLREVNGKFAIHDDRIWALWDIISPIPYIKKS